MKRIFLFLVFALVFNSVNYSQNNAAHHWYFGINAGVDFSTGVPTAVTNGQLNTAEGVATVDDSAGNLQFYTDGQEIYNSNHQLMPNGSGLLGNYSATQSSIVIPYPDNDNLFYLFTVDAAENHLQNGLRYSVIDMSLNNGMGDIILNQKNILLETPVSEKLTAVLHDNDEHVWVLAHRWNSNDFLAYKITGNGLDTIPVVSSIGTVHQGGFSTGSNVNGWTNCIGYMKASMGGEKLAVAIYRADIVELFDFNKFTGVVSNCITSPAILSDVYGIEFSPDGSKLYTTETDGGGLKQFDLNQTNPFSNYVQISATSQASALQIAPNGKIYLAVPFSYYLGEIEVPNNLGVACNYNSDALYLNGKQSKRGLPCIFINEHFHFFTGSNVEISICAGDSIYLEGAYQNIDGLYVDNYYSSTGIDSFVYTTLIVVPLPPQSIINEYGGVLWSTIALDYQWYLNGEIIQDAIDQTYEPDTTGFFSVEISGENGCTSMSDNFYYEFVSIDEILIGLKVYPNPVIEDIYIEGLVEGDVISLYDVLGNNLYTMRASNYSMKISLKEVFKGIIFLKINRNSEERFVKILKQ